MPTEVINYDPSCCCNAVQCCPGSTDPWNDELFLTAECVDPPGGFAPFSVPFAFATGVSCDSGFGGPLFGDLWTALIDWPEEVRMGGFSPSVVPPRDALFGCFVSGGIAFPPGGLALFLANCAGRAGESGFALRMEEQTGRDCVVPVVSFLTAPFSYFSFQNWFVGGVPAQLRFTVTP